MRSEETSHKTALLRMSASLPAKFLFERGLLVGRVLDFGAGHGYDARAFGMSVYDSKWSPKKPRGRFDTVVAIYVLNTRAKRDEAGILREIRSFLKPGGIAYLAVRRDIRREGFTSIGTYQRNVILRFPAIVDRKREFAIYVMKAKKASRTVSR